MSQDPDTPLNETDSTPTETGATAPAESPEPAAADGAPSASPAEDAAASEPVGAASDEAVAEAAVEPSADVHALELPEFEAAGGVEAQHGLDLLDDVDLNVKIELGRTEMYVEDVLRLTVGSVVELDKLAGDPVDIYVNERLIGRGEVLVLNDNFCVRVNEILSPVPERES